MPFQDKIRNPDCTLCPLHSGAQHVCLMGSGKKKAELMIVGEAPGEREDESHQAFVGPAGKLLTELLDQVGLRREDFYITNAVKCRPPNNRQPKRGEVKLCSTTYLVRELDIVKPRLCLVLGNTALQATTGRSGITKHRGMPVTKDGTTFFPTFHPAAVLRNPKYEAEVRADLRRFARLVKGETNNPVRTKIKLVRRADKLRELRELLMRADVIAFDLETDIIPPWEGGRIVSIAFTVEEGESWVVPLHHASNPWKDPAKVLQILKPCLERPDAKYVAQNGKFDCRWLWWFGIYVMLTFDTMLAAHILNENRSKGLKPLSQVILGADAYDVGEEIKDAYNMDLRKLVVYAGKDTDYTFRLYLIFKKQLLEQPRLGKVFARLMMPASNLLTKVELLGMYVDDEQIGVVKEVLEEEEAEILEDLAEYIPPDAVYQQKQEPGEINFNAPQQVAQWLFRDLKLNPIKKTKSGDNWSTDESVLLQLSSQHPAVRKLLDLRGIRKNLQFVTSWDEHRDSRSRIHTYYKLYGTVTGRLSSEEPNLQQVPREGPMRTCFGAPPGWTFVEADYSQIELRMVAWLAPEREMLRIFHTRQDIHLSVAVDMAKKTPEQVLASDKTGRTEYRKRAKGVNFGYVYGMGDEHFIEYARDNYGFTPTPQESKTYRERYFKKFPGLKPWHDRQKRLVRRYQRVHNPIGRIRHLPDVLSKDRGVSAEAERQAINSPIQSIASDCLLTAMLLLSRVLPNHKARIVGTVHDSALFEVKDEYLEEVLPIIKDTMEQGVPKALKQWFDCDVGVPLEAELKYGTNWGERKNKVWTGAGD